MYDNNDGIYLRKKKRKETRIIVNLTEKYVLAPLPFKSPRRIEFNKDEKPMSLCLNTSVSTNVRAMISFHTCDWKQNKFFFLLLLFFSILSSWNVNIDEGCDVSLCTDSAVIFVGWDDLIWIFEILFWIFGATCDVDWEDWEYIWEADCE